MQRRTLLKALVASAFASRVAYAAPPANMKGIEELQNDWKTFLPAGAAVPSPGDPLTENHCIRCGGHHGHLFDDGPPPTGQRWCNNGVALRFLPRSSA